MTLSATRSMVVFQPPQESAMATRDGQVSESMPTQTQRLEKRYLNEQTIRHQGLSEHYHVHRPARSDVELATVDELTDWEILPEPGVV